MSGDVAFFPAAASTTAHAVDAVFFFVTAVCGTMGLLVAVLLIYFSIRYRRRPGELGNPAETKASHALEWFWTIAPVGFFVTFFLWGAKVYVEAFQTPDDATRIYAVGKQWMWKFQHPEGQREINTLHVPRGQPIEVLLTSEDVIHSFFVPEFRVHMDVLPGRYTSVWFNASQAGTYHLFCSQYCGTNHASMQGSVVVMEPDDFQHWLSSSADGSLALQGRQIFLKYRCVSCHSADAAARAPVLEELYGSIVPLSDGTTVIADESYLRESILNPSAQIVAGWQKIMPTFKGQLDQQEIYALLAYFKSLKRGETPTRVEHFPPPSTTPSIDLP